MKRFLLITTALVLAMVMRAMAPASVSLADNQQILGYYMSDKLNNKGFGLPEWGENNNCKAAIKLTADMLKPYVGMKIVSIRFGLSYKLESSRVFITPVQNGYDGEDAVSQNVESTATGWNMVALDAPYIIEKDKSVLVGFDFAQKTRMKGLYYASECYPLSVVNEGITTMPILIYGNSGNGDCWHEIGTQTGNLSIQVIIEGNINSNSVAAYGFKTIAGEINKPSAVKVTIANNGKEAVETLNYDVYVDGNKTAGQQAMLDTPLEPGSTGSFTAQIPQVAHYGKYPVKIEVTQVNGNENNAEDRYANGYLGIPETTYPRNVVIEEFTTEECGNCPRVAGYLHQALSKLDRSRVFAVSHHSAFDTDWLTQPCDEEMYGLMFNGKNNSFAPAMMFNRDCDAIADNDQSKKGNVFLPVISAQISAYAQEQLNKTANSTLQMEMVQDDTPAMASVIIRGKCNEAYDMESSMLTVYLLEDSIMPQKQNGASDGFRHMHVIRYYNSTWGDAVAWNDDYMFEKRFDIDLFPEWKRKDLQVVAFLNSYNDMDYADNKIDNAIGVKVGGNTSGIYNITVGGKSSQTVRYTAEGVQTAAKVHGLNIIRMPDGKVVKVMEE